MNNNSAALRLTQSIVGMHAIGNNTALCADKAHTAQWAARDMHAWAQCVSLLPARHVIQGCTAPVNVRIVALTNPNATLLHTQDTLVAHARAADGVVQFITLDDMRVDHVLLVHVHSMGVLQRVPVSIGVNSVLDSPRTFLGSALDGSVRVVAQDAAVPVHIEKRIPVYPTQPANAKVVDHRLDTPAGKHAGTLALVSVIVVLVAVALSARTVL